MSWFRLGFITILFPRSPSAGERRELRHVNAQVRGSALPLRRTKRRVRRGGQGARDLQWDIIFIQSALHWQPSALMHC